MTNGLKTRIARITKTLAPDPPQMVTVIVRRFGGIADPTTITPPMYYLGKYAIVQFLGGTATERRRELKRLRASKRYDRLPHPPPALEQAADDPREERPLIRHRS